MPEKANTASLPRSSGVFSSGREMILISSVTLTDTVLLAPPYLPPWNSTVISARPGFIPVTVTAIGEVFTAAGETVAMPVSLLRTVADAALLPLSPSDTVKVAVLPSCMVRLEGETEGSAGMASKFAASVTAPFGMVKLAGFSLGFASCKPFVVQTANRCPAGGVFAVAVTVAPFRTMPVCQ